MTARSDQPQASHPAERGVDAEELAKFAELAERWWDPKGPMRPLHQMNPARLSFIRTQACAHFGRDAKSARPLEGLRLLDIGCGGGLTSEPMARLGAEVTGLDAAQEMVAVARAHAAEQLEGGERALDLTYRSGTAEALADEGARYDIVLALEIVEHVADPAAFLATAAQLVAPGGLLIVSTINRTRKSYLLAILGAEYVLRWLPRGTHDWKRFLRPSEIAAALRPEGLAVTALKGMTYNPLSSGSLSGGWRLERDHAVNYILAAARPG